MLKRYVDLQLGTVHYGYRDIWTGSNPLSKSGTCEIDTICPAGDDFRLRVHDPWQWTRDRDR